MPFPFVGLALLAARFPRRNLPASRARHIASAPIAPNLGNMTEGEPVEGHRQKRLAAAPWFHGPTLPAFAQEQAILRRNLQGAVYLLDG